MILDKHNQYRMKVASGQEKRGSPGPQPQAAVPMPVLVGSFNTVFDFKNDYES